MPGVRIGLTIPEVMGLISLPRLVPAIDRLLQRTRPPKCYWCCVVVAIFYKLPIGLFVRSETSDTFGCARDMRTHDRLSFYPYCKSHTGLVWSRAVLIRLQSENYSLRTQGIYRTAGGLYISSLRGRDTADRRNESKPD